MVLSYEPENNRIVIHVDASQPMIWRREPFFSDIKRWSGGLIEDRGQVVVWQGLDAIVVMPDREINLGRIGADQLILVKETRKRDGSVFREAFAMDPDDPRIAGKLNAKN